MTALYNACADLLDRNVDEGRGTKPAFVDPSRSLTYGELQSQTRRCSNLLCSLGLRREDRIVMIMLDTVDWPVVFLGAIRGGIVAVPLNTLLPPEQYAYMLADSRARAVFVSAVLWPAVKPALEGLPELEHVILVGGDPGSGHIDFAGELAKQSDRFDTAATSADEPAFWLYSSGSTGRPKGTRHIHSSPMATADLYAKGVLGIREDDVCFSAAKLFFAYGLGNGLSFPMAVGATAILNPDRPVPALMYEMMEHYQPTIFYGVPTLYAAMLGDPALKDKAGSPKLRISTSAGEALPEHTGSNWKKRFGSDILDGVGSTEMLHIFLSNAPGAVVYGTSGTAVPGYELRLLDDSLHPVADGDVGELYVNGPSAADGYWNQREKSRATFQGEWTRTGDKYTRDKAGRYTYCGRSDDMFKVSGIWVSPFEIETALSSHEAVLEAAVVPAKDAEGLLKPKAFVILKAGANRTNLEEALKEHVKTSVGMWKYPRWVEIVDQLPKTATGKIQRFKLREGG
ncbi:MAG: benzoate-CoA ligase family protein [Beijerinckiaceae bacterium]|jgi:4-hydroxybenzoate-CoA ligase|nr:benzoate-CoA ligase family protein [Beijerinckiaceae bacterium]